MLLFILIILSNGGFDSGRIDKIGVYYTEDSCKMARTALLGDETILGHKHVLCIPVDREIK